MLRITRSYSSSAVKKYFEHSDYYQEGPNALKGYFFGKGVELLGIKQGSEVQKEWFDRMVENRHPLNDGEQLTPKTRADRVVGADFTFSASKSVSILWALTQDEGILDDLRQAVNETLAEIEGDMVTRVHTGKQMHREKTGNMMAATWVHTTSRPVDGVPMPGLHCHAFVANATHDGERFKATDFAGIKSDAGYFEARFNSRLAQKIQDRLGVAIERQGAKWFEIAGFDRQLIERYSERTQQIEAIAKEKGITDPEQKAQLGAKTRQAKSKVIPPEDLPGYWRWMISDREHADLKDSIARKAAFAAEPIRAEAAVDYAISHQFSGKATVKERRLVADAVWRSVGEACVEQIDIEHGKRAFIRRGEDDSAWVTTKEVLDEERYLLGFARKGLNRSNPLAAGQAVERDWLSDEQKQAVTSLWHSTDRVMVLAGKAGTGKSTLALEAVEGMNKAGVQVTMVAPTTKAVSVLKKDGFQANTLAKLLSDQKMHSAIQGQVIWLDEAGLASTPDLAKLFRLAEQHDARIVVAGDRFQHLAVERGNPLELLETESGIKPITINTIRRQQDDALRQAVEKLSRGEVRAGFADLEKQQAVHVMPDELRNQELARRYADAVQAGESALVIAPTHMEKDQVTQAIRRELKARGMIGKAEREYVTFKRYRWDEAQRGDAKLYSVGDMVEFRSKGLGGFQPGERAEVTAIEGNRVMVQRESGVTELPLASAGSFAVFQPIRQRFAEGDLIRIQQNRRAKPELGQQRLNNGDVFAIRFRKDGQLDLGNGVSFDPAWGHFSHGRVSTSFSSQGDTRDRVFVAQSSTSFPASDPRQAYVSASRPRLSLDIFTDDLAGLKRAIGKDRSEESATSLARSVAAKQTQSRLKQQVERMKTAARRSRHYIQRQLTRLAQLLPQQQVQSANIAR